MQCFRKKQRETSEEELKANSDCAVLEKRGKEMLLGVQVGIAH